MNGIHEVRGSIPLGSTNKNPNIFKGLSRIMRHQSHCKERSLYHNCITESQHDWVRCVCSAGAMYRSSPLRNFSGTLGPLSGAAAPRNIEDRSAMPTYSI